MDESEELTTETPADESDRDTSTDANDKAPSQGSNRFAGIGSRMAGRMADADSTDDDDDQDDDGDHDDLDDDEDEEGGEAEKPPVSAKGEKGKEQSAKADTDDDEDGEPGTSRFEVVDGDGSKYELELPEGAKIKFNADGKTVEVDTIDKLVQMAQKGEAFDRTTSRLGSQLGTASARAKELAEDAEADRELVRSLVNGTIDEEDLKKLEALFAEEESNPDARAAREALEEKRRKEAEDQEGSTEAHTQATRDFWGATQGRIAETLPTFEYLDQEDTEEIKARFHQTYIARRAELVDAFVKIAKVHGVTEADAVQQADSQAITETLNPKTLRHVMKSLNDKYAKRAGKGGDGKKEKRELVEAKRHNQQIEARRASARDPANRSLRAGGSQMNTREPRRERDEPKSFEAKLERSLTRFRAVRRTATVDRDDEDDG